MSWVYTNSGVHVCVCVRACQRGREGKRDTETKRFSKRCPLTSYRLFIEYLKLFIPNIFNWRIRFVLSPTVQRIHKDNIISC